MANRTTLWTSDMIAYLRAHFPHESATDIADHFGISYTTVRLKALELGIKKSPDYNKKQYHYRWVKTYKHERYKNCKRAVC